MRNNKSRIISSWIKLIMYKINRADKRPLFSTDYTEACSIFMDTVCIIFQRLGMFWFVFKKELWNSFIIFAGIGSVMLRFHTQTIFAFEVLTFWQRSFTFNSDKSPIWCNNFSVYYPDVCLQLNMFRVFSRPSSGAQWLQWQPLVLPAGRPDHEHSTTITTIQR